MLIHNYLSDSRIVCITHRTGHIKMCSLQRTKQPDMYIEKRMISGISNDAIQQQQIKAEKR